MELRIFLSSFNNKILQAYKKLHPDCELNILLSYGTRSSDYWDMIVTNKHLSNSRICDSGAFTKNFANSNPTNSITLSGYIAFCKQQAIAKSFHFFFNFDEDFSLKGFETNLRNMIELENNGISVVPVVHDYLGEYFDEVGFYIQKQYPIIALGFSEHKQRDKKNNISSTVNRIVKAGLKVHVLGISSYDILHDIPVNYCDSSSWAQEGKYGNVLWWNPYKNGKNKTDRIKFPDKENTHLRHPNHIGDYEHLEEFEDYVKNNFNLDIVNLCGHNKEFNRQLLNVHYYVQLQDIIREEHKKRGF